MHVTPKKVCKGAMALDPNKIVVITEGPSGHIDVFASDPDVQSMIKRAKKHLSTLNG